jgi:hypothetical protein
MTPKMCEEFALMIGPTRETIYHTLSRNIDMSKFFFEKLNEGREEPFPVPFIKNLIGDSPLHFAVKSQN